MKDNCLALILCAFISKISSTFSICFWMSANWSNFPTWCIFNAYSYCLHRKMEKILVWKGWNLTYFCLAKQLNNLWGKDYCTHRSFQNRPNYAWNFVAFTVIGYIRIYMHVYSNVSIICYVIWFIFLFL